jgi:hypothetical protein
MLIALAVAVLTPTPATAATWSQQSMSAEQFVPTGVACPGANLCFAVGNTTEAPRMVINRWNGTSWDAMTATPPTDARYTSLSGIACSSTTACTAVGSYTTTGYVGVPLVMRWNGVTWSPQTTVRPYSASSGFSAVSCPSPTSCTAVGSYADPNGGWAPLAQHWDGTAWRLALVPKPSDGYENVLTGVSCISATSCVAVGTWWKLAEYGHKQILAAKWDGTTWQLQPAVNPAYDSRLHSVSCASATYCLAVGEYNKGGVPKTLAEIWNGSKWTQSWVPTPSGVPEARFQGVSCSAAKTCTAIGWYYDKQYRARPFAAKLAPALFGVSWKAQYPPVSAGFKDWFAFAVGCSSANACTGVGYARNDWPVVQPYSLRYM